MTPNVAAFLAMIRHAEGTDRAQDPYRVCFGFKHTIVDLSNHPALTGEWMGEPVPEHICQAMGIKVGTPSTAAGAYQYRVRTWVTLQKRLKLPNFSSQCQDDAAIEDINSIGALRLVNAGRFREAVQACRNIWASLPGNPDHQPQRSMDELVAIYQRNEGQLA